MGFCSGTDIFDPVAKKVLYHSDLRDDQKEGILKALIIALYDHDWDCESDSSYYNHSIVQKIIKKLNPE